MTDAPDFAGSRVGRYEVLSLLGEGGMGAVYDAIDPDLGRHVALKILPAHLAGDAQRLARFVQEARAASALNHPNVVAIYEIGRALRDGDEVHFIAMEKVEGRDLRATLTSSRLPPERAVELVAQVADAVAAAHEAGIIHRDLKPENIVLAKSGLPKVLDFGLAKLFSDEEKWSEDGATALRSTNSGMIMGTVGYMSPEQAQGKPADHRSDIFSLGCILYEAVTGRRAFAASSSVETLNAIIHSEPPPLSGSSSAISPELQRIVHKAMAKNPDERYQSSKDLVLDLRAMLRAPSTAPHRAIAPRNRRAWIAAGAVLAILALVSIAFALRSRREAVRPPAPPAATLDVRRVTARGTVTHAAISPDGRFVAYALLDKTVRLRQIATGEEIEVVRVAPLALWGLTFTPDGNSILYVVRDPRKQVASCFRVATIGGRPQRLFDGIDSPPAVSPDGRRIAYERAEYPGEGESALMVVNIDGTGARAVAVRRHPEKFVPLFFTGPSWSPDGQWIAAAVKRDAEPIESRLILVGPDSGKERPLVAHGWQLITQVSWLADGSGLVTVAAKDSDDFTRLQLWHVAYPDGTMRRITTEMSAYRGVSVAGQKDLLVSILLENNAQIWSTSLTSGTAGKISTGRYDGWRGLTLTPDGRVVFTSIEEDGQALVISNADGSGRTRLTRDTFGNQHPVSFRDGVAYISTTPRGTEVCVTNFDGDGRRVVVKDVDQAHIAVSPDGTWLLFRRNRRLWKMPLRGGAATRLLEQLASAPVWSPRDDRIALLIGDPDVYAAQLAVLSPDGRISWSTPLDGVHPGTTIRWLPDATGLIVNGGPPGTADDRNLWLYPFHGNPRRLTNFTDQRAYFWDVNRDGRSAFIARANLTRDAVLISGFR